MAIVMVIEDNPKLNAMFCRQLDSFGYTTHSAHSLREAIQVIGQIGNADAIVLDLELGDGDGRQFLDYLEDQAIETRRIVVSGHAYDPRFNLDRYEVDHILLKPISPRELCIIIRDLL